jgi:hypothetical protein
MKIVVDKEWLEKVSILADVALRAQWTKAYPLVTEILWSIDVLPWKVSEEKPKDTKEELKVPENKNK